LLRAVEAVDLIQEQYRPLAQVFQMLASIGHDIANILDARRDGIERFETAFGVVGNDVRESRFSRSGRSIEDQ